MADESRTGLANLADVVLAAEDLAEPLTTMSPRSSAMPYLGRASPWCAVLPSSRPAFGHPHAGIGVKHGGGPHAVRMKVNGDFVAIANDFDFTESKADQLIFVYVVLEKDACELARRSNEGDRVATVEALEMGVRTTSAKLYLKSSGRIDPRSDTLVELDLAKALSPVSPMYRTLHVSSPVSW